MGMKILWQDIWLENVAQYPELSEMWKGMNRCFKKVANPDTDVVESHLPQSSSVVQYTYLEMLNNTYIVDGIINAGKKGFDAAIIGCFADPGLHQARSVVNMPVLAAGESAMIVAQLLGRKFAVVTVGAGFVPIIEANLRLLGLEQRAIYHRPVRSFEMRIEDLIECFKGNRDPVVSQFEAVALECIHDGADVILCGCGYVGPAFSLLGYHEIPGTGVPVVDGTSAALKLAESLAGLQETICLTKSTSSVSIYAPPPSKLLTSIRNKFGFGTPQS